MKLSAEEKKDQDGDLEGEWTEGLIRNGRNGEGGIKACITNLVLILTKGISSELFKYNEFAFRAAYGVTTPWGTKPKSSIDDAELAKIKYWVAQHFAFDPSNNLIEDAVMVISHSNTYDPVRDWPDDLAEWDGKERLATWLQENFEGEGHPEYLKQVFTKWLVAMVARVYRPGTKFDWMPIFEGAQGVGKSSFGRALVGDKFFLDWLPNLADKEAALNLQGSWSVEMGELASFRKNEIETIKAFITRTVDKYRQPFGRRLTEAPRRCVFFGTTNRDTYLRDDTGNRRFKPVKVGQLNFEALARDRDQLFAEAKYLFKNVIKNIWELELDGEAKVFEKKIHAQKMVEDESNVMVELFEISLKKFIKKRSNLTTKNFKFLICLMAPWVG